MPAGSSIGANRSWTFIAVDCAVLHGFLGFSAREHKPKIEFVFLCVSRRDIITLIVTNPEVLLAGGLHEQFRGLCAHGVI